MQETSSALLPHGYMSCLVRRRLLLNLIQKMSEVWKTAIVVAYYVLESMTGMMMSEHSSLIFSELYSYSSAWSTRTKIREGHEDFLVTAQSWPIFLYEGFTCDVNNIEAGLFRSSFLLRVSILVALLSGDTKSFK